MSLLASVGLLFDLTWLNKVIETYYYFETPSHTEVNSKHRLGVRDAWSVPMKHVSVH